MSFVIVWFMIMQFVCGSSNERCDDIRLAANQWKPSPSDDYNDADYIIDNIYLGNVCAAHNLTWLKQNNITVIFNVATEWRSNCVDEHQFVCFDYPFDDKTTLDERHTRRHVNNITLKLISMSDKDSHLNILVHCNMGISRSTTVVIRYLQIVHDMTYREALAHIKKERPVVKPNRLLKKILIKQDL